MRFNDLPYWVKGIIIFVTIEIILIGIYLIFFLDGRIISFGAIINLLIGQVIIGAILGMLYGKIKVKRISISQIIVTIFIFIILYFIAGWVLFGLLSGHYSLSDYMSQLFKKGEYFFGPAIWLLIVFNPNIISSTNEYGGLGISIGISAFIGMIILLIISYYISKLIIKSPKQKPF